MTGSTATPDLTAVKERQQRTWAAGDYSAIAARIVLIAERLADAADVPAGSRVLDVATGSGNLALAMARQGCSVIGLDYVPALLDRARTRAAAEGLAVDLVEGDAEDLPWPDADFDAVVSCVGVMFAPDQERAAGELLRVCRSGGRIALANWTPEGFIGRLLRTVGGHVPPPAGVRPTVLWGTRARLAELFGDEVTSLETTPRSFVFRYPSAEAFVDFFRDWYGPVRQAFAALDDGGRERLYRDLVALVTAHDAGTGSAVAVPAEYLEVVAVRR